MGTNVCARVYEYHDLYSTQRSSRLNETALHNSIRELEQKYRGPTAERKKTFIWKSGFFPLAILFGEPLNAATFGKWSPRVLFKTKRHM